MDEADPLLPPQAGPSQQPTEKVLVGADTADCIICYEACSTSARDFPLECECKYTIHTVCFDEWVARNNGEAVCIICRKRPMRAAVILPYLVYAPPVEYWHDREMERQWYLRRQRQRHRVFAMVLTVMLLWYMCGLMIKAAISATTKN